ncbi:MAG: aminotransferase class V-fold PLP-dependent enzyme [Nonlabens sp.]
MSLSFPALQDCTYLNTPEQGLISQELLDYRHDLDIEISKNPKLIMFERNDFINQVRKKVASFLDVDFALTALIPNFSFGFNTLLDIIPKDYRFLLIKGDYPSINWPVEARGFECCYAELGKDLEKNIALAIEIHQPQVLCLSIVQYISGIKINLDFVEQLKQNYPHLIIIVDATQYIGVEEFRFRESGIDILAASCYKWMHAGNGNGFMCFNERVVSRLQPKHAPLNGTKAFENERGIFMGLFEPGHQDLSCFGSLGKAIDLINEVDLKTIQHSIKKLSLKAKNEFQKRNLLSKEVVEREIHSSIFNLKLDQHHYDKLIEKNVLCSKRGDGVRVGFHYYNTTADLNQLLNIIDHHL